MTPIVAGLTEKQSLAWLADATQAATAPVLSTDELRRLLVVAAINDIDGNLVDRFDRWVASDVYAIADRIVPIPRNGYVYKATVAGTAGSSAPSWPLVVGNAVVDGGVTWTCEDTAPWVPTYLDPKLRKAAAAGWKMKAGKRSDLLNASAGGTSVDPDPYWQFCLKMAARFAKEGNAGTISLSPSIYGDYPANTVQIA